MVPAETIEDQIKTADKTIDAAASDKNITKDESTKVDSAQDFLKDKKSDQNQEIQKKAKEIYENIEHKTKVAKGINKYFDLKDNTLTKEGQAIINTLNQEQIKAYLNIIKRVKETSPGKKAEEIESIDTKINTGIDIIVRALNEKQTALINAETTKNNNTLEDKLKSNPSIERAKAMFEDEEAIWKSIFANQKEGVLNLPEDTEKTEKNFSQNLQIYGECTIEENGKLLTYQIGGKAEQVKNFSYKIISSDGKDAYTKDDKYIQITIDVAGIRVVKDIMFGKEVKVIEKARADKSNKESKMIIAETKILSSDNIKEMHGTGSYEYLRQLVANNKIDLEKSLAGGLLSNIQTFYKNSTQDISLQDGTVQKTALENKEDGYYTTIAELVAIKAKAGDLEPIKEYLKHVNKDNLQYLGRNKAEQEKNMKILLSAGDENPGYKQEQWKDINTALQDMNMQIFPTQDILTQAKNGLKGIFDQYGENIIKFLNFLGIGKSFLYKICKTLGIDFKEVDEYYSKTYGLSEEATEASDEISNSYEGIERKKEAVIDKKTQATSKIDIKPTDAASLQTSFQETINKNNDFPSNNGEAFINNMNPALLSNLIDKYNTENPETPITKEDILINTKVGNGKEKLKVKKDAFSKLDGKASSLINLLIEDENTWNTIREANKKIRGDIPEGKETTDIPRPDLTKPKRDEMMIDKPSDMVKYLNYYAFSGKTGDLDYVITETKVAKKEGDNSEDTEAADKEEPEIELKEDFATEANGVYTLQNILATTRIHDIFSDYKSAPEDLIIKIGGEEPEKKITKGNAMINGKETETYVYTDNPTKRVKINDRDQIKLPAAETAIQTEEGGVEEIHEVKGNATETKPVETTTTETKPVETTTAETKPVETTTTETKPVETTMAETKPVETTTTETKPVETTTAETKPVAGIVEVKTGKVKPDDNTQDYSINNMISSKELAREDKNKFNISEEAKNKMKEYELDAYPSEYDEKGKITKIQIPYLPGKINTLSLKSLDSITGSVAIDGTLKIMINYEGHTETTEIKPKGGDATVKFDDGEKTERIRDAEKNRRDSKYYYTTPNIGQKYGGKYNSDHKKSS